MDYRLIAMDLDGTLNNDEKRITPKTLEALMAAQALNVPLIIARRTTKVYEGSAVNISYVSGNGSIETMSLSRRAVKEGSRALIVDDFLRGGGTAGGMVALNNASNHRKTASNTAKIIQILQMQNRK